MVVQHAGLFCPSNFRVVSGSADRTITIHEVFSNRQVTRVAFPEAITACTSNHTFDILYVGSSSGQVYILDLSATAVSLTAAHSNIVNTSTGVTSSHAGNVNGEKNSRYSHSLQEGNYSILIGHDKAVTSLSLAQDNYTLVTASLDGTVKIWNTISRQCIKDIDPFSKSPLSNIMVCMYCGVLPHFYSL